MSLAKKRYDNSIYAKRWREKNPEKARAASAAWRQRNLEKAKRSGKNTKLIKAYGISLAEFERKLRDQDGKCAICSIEFGRRRKDMHVDHCHLSGQARLLLCGNCNNMIGRAHDDSQLLRMGAEYLDAWRRTSWQFPDGPPQSLFDAFHKLKAAVLVDGP